MNAAMVSAALLAFGVLAGSARLLWHSWRAAPARRPRPWRTGTLMLGQMVAAVLLYATMWPPPTPVASDSLTVVTARATPEQVARIAAEQRVVALAEAPVLPGVERVPDLATALRRHPSVAQLKVIGAGLPPRDLDAARSLGVTFDAAPLPSGLVELWYPKRVASGATWRVAGTLHDGKGGSVELLDPARRRIARATPGPDGRFEMHAESRAPGRTHFSLRVLDRAQRLIEEVGIPLLTVSDAPLRVLVLAGAPSPEIKYLRRWALDAGVDLRSEISVRPGMSVQRSAAALTPDALRELDLVVIDERAWRSAGAAGRTRLLDAVTEGLGLLFRVTGALSANERDELQSLGFDIRTPRWPLDVVARDGVPLLRDAQGQPLALWQTRGRGRIALWWLNDSYRMALDGSTVAYGTLWSDAFSTLGRARGSREPVFADTEPRVDQRQVICGLDADAGVAAPDGRRMPLLTDASTGCAAYWPEGAGWHVLHAAAGEWPFYVRGAGVVAGLALGDMRAATMAITGSRTAQSGRKPAGQVPGSPWPYLLSCLAVLAATWWLERSQLGRRMPQGAA